MRASKLRHRIMVYKSSNTPSPMGGTSSASWMPWRTLWASFEPLSVKDVISSQAAGSQITARCVIRHRTDIDSTMQVEHRGQRYKIDGDPLPDDRSGLEYITLILKSVP